MNKKFILLTSLLLLSSCATQIDKLGSNGLDHSGKWQDNYYSYFDASLKDKQVEEVTLDKEINKVFTTYNDDNFKALEAKQTEYVYAKDYDDEPNNGYGPNMKLSKYLPGVKDGFTSKLFDGKMFCYGRYEAVRMQIKETGVGYKLPAQLNTADYLFLNFKSSLDFKSQEIPQHTSDITVSITLYKEDKGIKYSYSLKDVISNSSEGYIFYGFSLKELDIKGVNGFAITYHLDKDTYIEESKKTIDHALLLYEFGFGNPTF